MPKFAFGFRHNPTLQPIRNPALGDSLLTPFASPIRAVSLFAGCGGLDLGMLGGFCSLGEEYPALPVDVVAAYDNDPLAVATYKLNLSDHIAFADLTQTDPASLPAADLLLGGFPCQDFSSCGPKQGLDGKRGRLYRVLCGYMRAHRPALVIGENVPHLARMEEGRYLDEIASDMAAEGYRVKVWRLYCPDYGLPQNRERIFFMCVRDGIGAFPEQPVPTHFMAHRPIEAAIGDLEGTRDESVPNQSQYFVATKATRGAGQGDQVSRRGQVAYAVRANPKARVHFHYSLPRRLTVRECARLQSFPDEFVFPHSTSGNMVNIGNAVPPIVAHAVGREVVAFFHRLRQGDKQ